MKMKKVDLRVLFLVSCNLEFFLTMIKMLSNMNVKVNEERLFDYIVNECKVDLSVSHIDNNVLSYSELSRLSSLFNSFLLREKSLKSESSKRKEVKEVKDFKETRTFKRFQAKNNFFDWSKDERNEKHKHSLTCMIIFEELRDYYVETKLISIEKFHYIIYAIYQSNVLGIDYFDYEEIYYLFDFIRSETLVNYCCNSDIDICILKYNIKKILKNCL